VHLLLWIVAYRVQVLHLQASQLLLRFRNGYLIVGRGVALIHEGAEGLLLLLALRLGCVRRAVDVLAALAAVTALVV